ncbi:UNVERIFIED_CONTAM: serine protease Do [Acetivibrio alkalicellulosi]
MDDYNKNNEEMDNTVDSNYVENDELNSNDIKKENYYQNDSNSNEDSIDENGGTKLKETSFYTESYNKPKKKKNATLAQLIIVALMSSILGGAVSGVYFHFLAPVLQPSVNALLANGQTTQSPVISGLDSDYYRKVVIESSDSPVVAIAEKVGPSVVGINVQFRTVNDFFFFQPREAQSQGSGIIIKSDGYIMTNNHVIERALEQGSNNINRDAKIEIILPHDKDTAYLAKVVGRDVRTDLAVLKIDKDNLPAIEFGDSDNVKVGELAVAIGNPGGLEYMGSVTVGVISGLNRTLPILDGRELKLIQTDASINEGNSGGALVNAEGKLIGINTAKIAGGTYEGLGFAIPVNRAKEITDSLIEFTYVKRPFIGIEPDLNFTEEVAQRYGVPIGVFVEEIIESSPAQRAGINRMDIITKFNGVSVKSLDELIIERDKFKPGDRVMVEIYRRGEYRMVELELDVG